MFLVFRQVDVRRMPKYREDIIIQTSIFDCKQAFGLRNTNIYDANENPCILSWSIGAFVNLQTGKMIRLTPAEMKNVKYDEKQKWNICRGRLNFRKIIIGRAWKKLS